MRGRPQRLILDDFDTSFFITFDFEENPEDPESVGKCDIGVVPLPCDDILADCVWLIHNANKHGVLRFLAAIGIQRFGEKVKTAFYASTNPLRNSDPVTREGSE